MTKGEAVRALADFEKLLLFLQCAESGGPCNRRTVRMLFGWDDAQYDAVISTCIERGFITASDEDDILNESVLI